MYVFFKLYQKRLYIELPHVQLCSRVHTEPAADRSAEMPKFKIRDQNDVKILAVLDAAGGGHAGTVRRSGATNLTGSTISHRLRSLQIRGLLAEKTICDRLVFVVTPAGRAAIRESTESARAESAGGSA